MILVTCIFSAFNKIRHFWEHVLSGIVFMQRQFILWLLKRHMLCEAIRACRMTLQQQDVMGSVCLVIVTVVSFKYQICNM
jgi:hypothetical protein